MKQKTLITLIVTSAILLSCSDDEITPSQNVIEYAHLEIGNYWVYEWFEIEPDGTESSFNQRDSLFIEGDSTIADRTYLVRKGTFLGNGREELLFDSANAVFLYPSRELLFTLDPVMEYSTTYGPEENPLATATYSLAEGLEIVNVPAGEFVCLNYRGVTESLEQDYPHGTRINANLYSDGIGLVLMQTQFYSSPNELEMRLVKNGRK